MAGIGLVNDGDVQIGTDSQFLLCSASSPTSLASASFNRALNFNPWVWPDLQTDDTPWWHRPGMRAGADIPTGRRIEFIVLLKRTTRSSLTSALSTLSQVTQPIMTALTEQELSFRFNGTKYTMYGRFREVDAISTENIGKHELRVRIRFLATDPIIYDSTQTTAVIPRFATNQSQWHLTTSVNTMISTATAASPFINVGGTAPARYELRITGPAVNPVVSDGATGRFTWLAQSGGLQIPASTTWTVNSATRKILNHLGNDNSDKHAFPSHWLNIQPGGSLNKLAVSINVTFPGSAAIPGGTQVNSQLAYQRGWWAVQ